MKTTFEQPRPEPLRTVIALGRAELIQAIIDFAVKNEVTVPKGDRFGLTWIEDEKDGRQILFSVEQDTEIIPRRV